MIQRSQIERLANQRSFPSLSIFIPTHRRGQETKAGVDRTRLKNALQKAERMLDKGGMSENERTEFLESAWKLVDQNPTFWSYLKDGLCLFKNGDVFEYFILPVEFEEQVKLSDTFYLRPVLPYLHGEGRFFLLSLELNNVQLFEGSDRTLDEIDLGANVNTGMDDFLDEYELRQDSLQARSSGVGPRVFHGHGGKKDEKKIEIRSFLREIDQAVMAVLYNETVPLIIAGVDYVNSMYRDVSRYGHIAKGHISGSPKGMNENELCDKAVEISNEVFRVDLDALKSQFQALEVHKRAATDVKEILQSARQGRVERLMVNKNAEVKGYFDEENFEVVLDDDSDHDILNMSAVQTFLKDGLIYDLSGEDMPDDNSPVNAIYRY